VGLVVVIIVELFILAIQWRQNRHSENIIQTLELEMLSRERDLDNAYRQKYRDDLRALFNPRLQQPDSANQLRATGNMSGTGAVTAAIALGGAAALMGAGEAEASSPSGGFLGGDGESGGGGASASYGESSGSSYSGSDGGSDWPSSSL
jgi:hypothetical protein